MKQIQYFDQDFDFYEMIPYFEQKLKNIVIDQKQKSKTLDGWEDFYYCNKNKFFKDRNYLQHCFPSLIQDQQKQVLEIGCGVGNSIFPLLQHCPQNYQFSGCDVSQSAINIFQQNQKYDKTRINSYVCDIVKDNLDEQVYDYVILIFTLSAIQPQNFNIVIQKIDKNIKIGSKIFIRDYALFDHSMFRLHEGGGKISENFYQRGDNTYAYFFTKEKLIELFEQYNYSTESIKYCTILQKNKKDKSEMHKIYINAVFVKNQ